MTDTRLVWNRIADFWDQHLKEGNDFQKKLIMPATDALLGDVEGKTILDACCGNGNYARVLASRNARVVAFDGSDVFIERAKARTTLPLSIDYHVIDACDEAAMLSLGESRFDAVVCSMAVMDLPVIDPLFRASHRLLKPRGIFVFSVCHPAFNSPRIATEAKLINENGQMRQRFSVSTEYYLSAYQDASQGMINQPEPHPMFHRPISMLLKHLFDAGFVVDGFDEPAFALDKKANPFSFAKRPEIPPALVIRASKCGIAGAQAEGLNVK